MRIREIRGSIKVPPRVRIGMREPAARTGTCGGAAGKRPARAEHQRQAEPRQEVLASHD
ncbi:MAG TPA: hypothetical protein VM389_12300 [Phycisphaerae bacterium]|nr:hypothetical protein [Phycisphaerae bacterium]